MEQEKPNILVKTKKKSDKISETVTLSSQAVTGADS